MALRPVGFVFGGQEEPDGVSWKGVLTRTVGGRFFRFVVVDRKNEGTGDGLLSASSPFFFRDWSVCIV